MAESMPTTLQMQITCPRCDTSYGVDGAAFPREGRAVRCARCQEVWTAQPEQEYFASAEPVSPDLGPAAMPEEGALLTDSPPLADANPPSWSGHNSVELADDAITATAAASVKAAKPSLLSRITNLFPRKKRATTQIPLRSSKSRSRSQGKLGGVVAGLAAVVVGLVSWRADIVRLMPQTAIAFQAIGKPVNLRGMAFQDMKVKTETVDGAPVMVIEGTITSVTQKAVEVPRLRFIVRDERGNEIYAWNAVLEQAVLKPGETLSFRSRLASPPPEARDLEIRFFNRRDLARGAA
jgi:predicted Zn finger-like uncharacterized protein